MGPSPGAPDGDSLSVVIPTLDEEACIAACLESVGSEPGVEIVVSDGGSRDRTIEVASRRGGVRVVTGDAGRGAQLRRGAAAASGSRLLFVHADCRLPEGWRDAVLAALADPEVALVSFRLHTEPPPGDPRGPVGRTWLRLLDLRSRGLGLPYGDQGMGLRREVLDEIGGFPEVPLMEDLELARRCRRVGRVRILPLEMRTTARRFVAHPVRTRLMTATFPLLYRLGVPADVLARWYGRGR